MEIFPISLKLQGQPCLIVGGGHIAYRKAVLLAKAGAVIHVGFIDTDLTQSLDIAKISPHTVAQHVFDGIQQNAFEVLVGESTQQLKQGLTATPPSYIKH